MFFLLYFGNGIEKLHNGIMLSILGILTVFFAGVMVSYWPDLYFGYENNLKDQFFGKLFYNFWWYEFARVRLNYILFFIFFILFTFNAKLTKLPNKTFFSILALAVISNLIWLIEVVIRGWKGLYWLEYIHIAIFMVGILFLCWLVFINRENKNDENKKDILFYGILYALFSVTYITILKLTFGHVKINNNWNWIFFDIPKNFVHYIIFMIVQMSVIFALNIIIAKYEKVTINAKIVFLNLCTMIIIPICSFFSSVIISDDKIKHISTIFDLVDAFYYDPIDWVKLGSIIFGFVIYECSYIAYLKKGACII
jgi:hypothetical protein